jgi:DNA invertase Pin-like site-specific DNA recombinase
MTICGYARVSTDGQTLDAQEAALRAAGAEQVFAIDRSLRQRCLGPQLVSFIAQSS